MVQTFLFTMKPGRSIRARVILLLLVECILICPLRAAGASDETFSFFYPAVVVTAAERQALDRGEVLVRVLPGSDKELAILAIVRVKAAGVTLIENVREIADFKRGPLVLAIRRFSDTPNIHDLDSLALGDADLEGIGACKIGDCNLKLGAGEMERLRKAAIGGPRDAPALQNAFRHIVLDRAKAYLDRGHQGIPDYQDQKQAVNVEASFTRIIRHSPYLLKNLPRLVQYLENYPRVRLPDMESFLYWSKELYGQKPVIIATQVSMIKPEAGGNLPEAVVAGKQIFSTHYTNGSLNLTMVLRGSAGSHNYLAYVNRSEVDLLGGWLGWLKRTVVERRLKEEAVKILPVLKERLERREALRRKAY
ncbi:MAG TPA: hypothetical protein VGK99_14160 [Acidobacteriota bacterium]